MKTYKVRAYNIDYCVEEEDVVDSVNVRPEYTTSWYDAIDEKIAQIKSELPQDMVFDIECEPEDLEEEITDAISNETGWLIVGYDYDIL